MIDQYVVKGIGQVVMYSKGYLSEERREIEELAIPDIRSKKFLDRLELFLYHSDIRTYLPFLSARLWIYCCILLFLFCLGIGTWLRRGWMFSIGVSIAMIVGVYSLLSLRRKKNLKRTENDLLEFINLAESFSITEDELLGILLLCGNYMKGPIGRVLQQMERERRKGRASRLILEQLKVKLEHVKWQEFIHNLSVCSAYNSDYNYVFHAARKSVQSYLISKKERASVKRLASLEMLIMLGFGVIIVFMLGNLLEVDIQDLLMDGGIGSVVGIYIAVISLLFWKKINRFEMD